jgi:hypothetical protein
VFFCDALCADVQVCVCVCVCVLRRDAAALRAGLFLGYTFVQRGDGEEGGGKGGGATPPVALRFALAQSARGLDEYNKA